MVQNRWLPRGVFAHRHAGFILKQQKTSYPVQIFFIPEPEYEWEAMFLLEEKNKIIINLKKNPDPLLHFLRHKRVRRCVNPDDSCALGEGRKKGGK